MFKEKSRIKFSPTSESSWHKTGAWWWGFIFPFIGRVPFSEKFFFAKHLSIMIKAALPLREAVAIIQEQSKSKNFKKVLDDVLRNIDNGQSLAVSLSRHPRVFDILYINMIRIGEESGTLEENLKDLASQLEKSRELRKQVKSAMVYPLIILTTAFLLSAALIFFILPRLTSIFETLDIQLPLATRVLIGFTELTRNYSLFIFIFLFFLAFTLILISRIRTVKMLISKIAIRFPITGVVSRNVNISHLSRTLGILLKSGLPIIRALDITQTTLRNLVYQKELGLLKEEVKKGKPMYDYLRKRENLFPLTVSRIIGVGEKTGTLEETLFYVGKFYEVEVARTTKLLSTVLEPALLLIIGTVVGFLVLAIISPIYEITQGLHI